MIRKLAYFSAAILVSSTAFFAYAASAPAASTVYDTSAASVQCDTFIGTVGVKPNLGGVAQPTKLTVKGTLTGCNASGTTPAGLSVVSGAVSGTLTNANGSCGTLFGASPVTGNLTVKWKVASGQKLDHSSSVLTPGSITGGLFTPGGSFGAATYAQFTFGGTLSGTSAFLGGTPSAAASSAQDVGNLGALCAGAGIKTINIGIGTVTL